MYFRIIALATLLIVISLGLLGCATVPKEAVYLSYTIGEDLQQLHEGYRNTIKFSFDQIRKRGLYTIENTWTHAFIGEFIYSGKLIDAVNNKQSDRIEYWARKAIKTIEEQRRGFLDPLQVKEDALLAQIDEAFGRVIRANASVTALVNSVKKVQDLQDDVLNEFGLKNIGDTINNGIEDASDFADKQAEEIQLQTKEIEEKTKTVKKSS